MTVQASVAGWDDVLEGVERRINRTVPVDGQSAVVPPQRPLAPDTPVQDADSYWRQLHAEFVSVVVMHAERQRKRLAEDLADQEQLDRLCAALTSRQLPQAAGLDDVGSRRRRFVQPLLDARSLLKNA